MQVPIYNITHENGFYLYRREKTKYPNVARMLKYFIKHKDNIYYQEFRTLRDAEKEFSRLIKNR